MQEIFYTEVPTPNTQQVRDWLHQSPPLGGGEKVPTAAGVRWKFFPPGAPPSELSIFVWSVQNTTYLKVFRWGKGPIPRQAQLIRGLQAALNARFPYKPPQLPPVPVGLSVAAALAPFYPRTVAAFAQMPQGEAHLTRLYWWEQRWRASVLDYHQPRPVVFRAEGPIPAGESSYDLVYVGGALGVVHAAVMASLGYRVLLIERLPFGRMNREWNISRQEFQTLIDLGLFTAAEFESVIAREYLDGFHQFFAANNPPSARAPVLHTPTVLNVGLDAEKFLALCGEKLRQGGGEIWDQTEFQRGDIFAEGILVSTVGVADGKQRQARGRLLIDAMGTASPIAWQLNGGRAFDSVCPTVGAVVSGGFELGVWDCRYGDVLYSHGDISRGRQLIWELFPGAGDELTFYLFHYHQVQRDNPGSLLEMYEDFFTILPEYRRCDPQKLVWKKPTFGYIPGHFSLHAGERRVAWDRLMAIGDAASLQSPLVFTGFGSLIRNLGRLTHLLDTALRHDLLRAQDLNLIRAYQSNVSVTWLFSKGMMVPPGKQIPPQRINSMLNVFFGILGTQPPEVAAAFIKDRCDWLTFNRIALTAAFTHPVLLRWIWQLAGPRDMGRWVGSYLNFTLMACLGLITRGWLGRLLSWSQPWLEKGAPRLWLQLLAWRYELTNGLGNPQDPPTPGPRSGLIQTPAGQGEAWQPQQVGRQ